jgi:hypothetical protein
MTILAALAVLTGLSSPPAIAHNVEVADDVAATFHIEPNHNPRAGEQSQAWFALTRQGGALLPLQQCNCTLQVYTEPRQPNAAPVLQPPLQAINAEQYRNIPGATLVFPQAGIYTLQLSGTPKAGGDFQAFTLKYSVTVAAGKPSSKVATAPSPTSEPPAIALTPTDHSASRSQWMPWAILGVVGGVAIGLIATRKR